MSLSPTPGLPASVCTYLPQVRCPPLSEGSRELILESPSIWRPHRSLVIVTPSYEEGNGGLFFHVYLGITVSIQSM